jgi:hypothetical protein
MARRFGAALVLAGLAVVAVLLLMDDRGAGRARAREAAVAPEPALPAREERGPGGEEGRPETAPAPGKATIRGTVSGESGPIWGVRIFAVLGEDTVFDTGTDLNGRYQVEVPADRDVLLELRPDPATGLLPLNRALRLAAGEEIEQDFTLESPPAASGRVEGLAADDNVTLFAIRAEDFPLLPPDPLLAAAALDAVPKLSASTRGGPFRFLQLDPKATYRLVTDGLVWAVGDPVYFNAGDNAIVARLDLVIPWSVDAIDIETGTALERFTAKLVDLRGEVRDTLEGRLGRAERTPLPPDPSPGTEPRGYWRWRREVTDFLRCCTFVVNADGYHEESFRLPGTTVALQRIREPNVLLRVTLDDGTPYDGDLVGRFGPRLDAVFHVRQVAPGRFLADMPSGKWQLRLVRPGVFFDSEPALDLVVPREGMIEPQPLVFARTGTVTFESESRFGVQRMVDGRWHFREGEVGTFAVPVGSYRIVRGEDVVATFEILAGGRDVIKLPRFR